jgi:isochorismate pyruvate lyase
MAQASSTLRSPASCGDMTQLRAEIDRLDRQLVEVLAERSGYVARAAELKKERTAIVDEARIEEIIGRVRGYAVSHDADPELIEAIYRAMIAAFIAFEEKAFDKK